jgi:hypothetical protein
MTTALRTDFVTLKGGHRVPVGVLQLAWDLEERGFTITTDGTLLVIRPKARLTPDDDAAIREHRDDLLALTRYCDEVTL